MKTQYEVLVIWIIWVVLGIYLATINYLMKENVDDYNLLFAIVKSDGLMICLAITLVKLIELMRFKLFDPISRLLLVLLIYAVVYGLRAGPYMIVSFVQPFARHILAQFLLLFLLIELCLYCVQMRMEKKKKKNTFTQT